jgi:hypothetical protein
MLPILEAFFKFGPLVPVAILLRYGAFVFLDARLHFREQRLGEGFLPLHILLEPLVFRFEIVEDIRVIDLGIALNIEPLSGVADRDAVALVAMRPLLGDGRFFHFFCHGLFCFRLSEGGRR